MNEPFLNSGWRPMIGWACWVAIVIQYNLRPLCGLVKELIGGAPLAFQADVAQSMVALVVTLIGMAALRSADKAVSAKLDQSPEASK